MVMIKCKHCDKEFNNTSSNCIWCNKSPDEELKGNQVYIKKNITDQTKETLTLINTLQKAGYKFKSIGSALLFSFIVQIISSLYVFLIDDMSSESRMLIIIIINFLIHIVMMCSIIVNFYNAGNIMLKIKINN